MATGSEDNLFFHIPEELELPPESRRDAHSMWSNMTGLGQTLGTTMSRDQFGKMFFTKAVREDILNILCTGFDLTREKDAETIDVPEFLVLLSCLSWGTDHTKALGLMFSTFCTSPRAGMSYIEFLGMVQSIQKDNPDKVGHLDASGCDDMFRRVCGSHDTIKFEAFQSFMSSLEIAPHLHVPMDEDSPVAQFLTAQRGMRHLAEYETKARGSPGGWPIWVAMTHYCDPTFCLFQLVYFAMSLVIIFERKDFYDHKVELLTIAPNVGLTRITAQLIAFNIAITIYTKCRISITFLLHTPARFILPLKFMDELHYQAGLATGVCSLIHVLGHGENWIDISQGMNNMVACTLDVIRFEGDPSTFFSWNFETVTLASGSVLTIFLILLFASAIPVVRRFAYDIFKIVHLVAAHSTILVTFLHGSAALIQDPHYFYFVTLPVCIYAVEQVLFRTTHRRVMLITDVEWDANTSILNLAGRINESKLRAFSTGSCELAAGYVWVQIPGESIIKHPFSLSASPKKDLFFLNIRVHGPYTKKLKEVYASQSSASGTLAKELVVYGPVGAGLTDWRDAQVVVGLAAGVGVAPILNVVNEVLFSSNVMHHHQRRVKLSYLGSAPTATAVYLAWSMRSKQFSRGIIESLGNMVMHDDRGIFEPTLCVTREGPRTTVTHVEVGHRGRGHESHIAASPMQPPQTPFGDSTEKGLEVGDHDHFERATLASTASATQRQHRISNRFGPFRQKEMEHYLMEICRKHPSKRVRVPICGPSAFMATAVSAVQVVKREGFDIEYCMDQAFS